MMATPVEYLDLATVIKVSQAVSGEDCSGKSSSTRSCALRSSMRVLSEGLLILQRWVNEQRVEAEA